MPASFFPTKFDVRRKCRSYFDSFSNLHRAIDKIENFDRVNYITICNNFEEYVSGVQRRSRIKIVWMTRIATFISALRFYLSIFLRNSPVHLYLMDISPLLGHPIMIPLAVGIVSLAILAIGLTVIYQEQTHTTHLLELFYLINRGLIRYPLKVTNFRKYAIRINLVTDFVFKEFYISLVVFVFGMTFVVTLNTLINNEFDFLLLVSFIFFNFIFLIHSIQCFGYVWVGFTMWFMSTLYLKYKFNEINEKIELSLKYSNINLLMNAIHEHNYVEIMTKKFNHFFRMITFIIYYIATIGFQIFLFAVHYKDSTFLGRFFTAFIFGSCFWAVVLMNVMSISVSNASKRPYSKLYSFYKRNEFRIIFRQRWKILSFVEKLSGPEIGYYCYDLFPMNNWEFYQYLYIAGSNYILIMNLFNGMF